MTQTEAISKLEDWLLIPVGIEDTLPALVALRGSVEYQSYLERVAEADYRTVEDLAHEVDACAEKLALSEREARRVRSAYAPALENASKKNERSSDLEAFRKFTNGRVSSERTARERRCALCGGGLELRETEGLSSDGVIWVIIAALFCLPLIFIPLLACREKKREYYCPRCGNRHR